MNLNQLIIRGAVITLLLVTLANFCLNLAGYRIDFSAKDNSSDYAITISEDSMTTGTLYFELAHSRQESGNYMLKVDRATGDVLFTKEFSSFGMKFERHTDELLSYYDYPIRVWRGQDNHRGYGGIRYHTGGVMRIMDNDYRVIDTIEDGINVDSHDLVRLDNGWLYFAPDIRPLDRSQSTITCLLECGLIGQNLVLLSDDGNKQMIWSALDYYDQRDFVMDDVFELDHNILYDVIHANSVHVTPAGNYIISMRHPDEVMIIDPDGELVWRSRDYTIYSPFAHQHDAQLLSNGNLILFDNGNGVRNYSRAVEYAIDHEQQTLTSVWEYATPDQHFAPNRGSVQRLDNGNTLINFVDGGIVEVTPDGEIMLEITMPEGYASYQARWFE